MAELCSLVNYSLIQLSELFYPELPGSSCRISGSVFRIPIPQEIPLDVAGFVSIRKSSIKRPTSQGTVLRCPTYICIILYLIYWNMFGTMLSVKRFLSWSGRDYSLPHFKHGVCSTLFAPRNGMMIPSECHNLSLISFLGDSSTNQPGMPGMPGMVMSMSYTLGLGWAYRDNMK